MLFVFPNCQAYFKDIEIFWKLPAYAYEQRFTNPVATSPVLILALNSPWTYAVEPNFNFPSFSYYLQYMAFISWLGQEFWQPHDNLPSWRRRWDSNPRMTHIIDGLVDRSYKPLWHFSVVSRALVIEGNKWPDLFKIVATILILRCSEDSVQGVSSWLWLPRSSSTSTELSLCAGAGIWYWTKISLSVSSSKISSYMDLTRYFP